MLPPTYVRSYARHPHPGLVLPAAFQEETPGILDSRILPVPENDLNSSVMGIFPVPVAERGIEQDADRLAVLSHDFRIRKAGQSTPQTDYPGMHQFSNIFPKYKSAAHPYI